MKILFVTNGNGIPLRRAGITQAQISRNAWLFGFSTTGLNSLASAATNPTLRAALERMG